MIREPDLHTGAGLRVYAGILRVLGERYPQSKFHVFKSLARSAGIAGISPHSRGWGDGYMWTRAK